MYYIWEVWFGNIILYEWEQVEVISTYLTQAGPFHTFIFAQTSRAANLTMIQWLMQHHIY